MSVKLIELREPLLDASEPRLEARDPRLLLDDTVRELADRLDMRKIKRHVRKDRAAMKISWSLPG